MELKEYQVKALDSFKRWHELLDSNRIKCHKLATTLHRNDPDADVPDELLNFPRNAWKELTGLGPTAAGKFPYVDRTDKAGRPIPHVCFKVPTGGGKTLLAAAALKELPQQTGLVLWVTPTRAIYEQTKAALSNREHPYREMLEIGSGGRVKFIEKDYELSIDDASNYLCVMLLSLPAASRQRSRDFLRMFRDTGRYPTIFPDTDDVTENERLLSDFPDLECGENGGPVKHSLFNVFKILRPLVVLDEAHKAYGRRQEESDEFVRVINQFDPSLVIELSATPNQGISNLLVDITGTELKQEEMIKLPIQVSSFTGAGWKDTLAEAQDKLEQLDAEAQSLQASEGRYIRPIALVRVERTGRDQRDADYVHAYDVRDHLIQNLGIPENQIAIKTSDLNELDSRDKLMSESSTVRWIITKAALMEGWDCSFAYLLVMLDNTQAQRAITQMVGRVMRQPDARRTGYGQLDQCYVYCWNTEVGEVVKQVKNGLEREGLSDLGSEVYGPGREIRRIKVNRRPAHRGKDIYLPKVLHREGGDWVELDYRRNILPHINWGAIDAPKSYPTAPDPAKIRSASVDLGPRQPMDVVSRNLCVDKTVLVSWFARRLLETITNPWQAARIAARFMDGLRSDGKTDEQIYDSRAYFDHELRRHAQRAVETQAEEIFKDKILHSGDIRFDLEAGEPNFRIVENYEVGTPVGGNYNLMEGKDGLPVQASLFEPVYTQQFDNELERKFARYLDEVKALRWWHRVAAQQSGDYYLRGWKRDRIWPDFVAVAEEKAGKQYLLLFETKGDHLRNVDTEYKLKVMKTLEHALNCGTMKVRNGPARGVFRMVFNETEFPAALAGISESQ